jgi:phosphoribosylformylglycinamidine synthase
MSSLNICSQKGLVEKFDSTIGAGTVLMPYGGVYQLTPAQAMAAKIPVLKGETSTCSIMGWGFNPVISEHSPYHGAIYAVIESVAKVIAAGGSWHQCWLTFQEYFERTQNNPRRWGKPFSALLGAFRAQLELSCASIGGKDSMSGTFENIDVPPTLVSFAVSTADTKRVISTEFKEAGSTVIRIAPEYSSSGLPNWESVRAVFDQVEKLISDGRAKAIWSVENGGVAEGLAKMAFGNHIGFEFTKVLPERVLFDPCAGSFIIELNGAAKPGEEVIGRTTEQYKIFSDTQTISLDTLQKAWEGKLESVFPCRIKTAFATIEAYSHKAATRPAPAVKTAKPRVLIPVFPGTNCEYDSAKAVSDAGAEPEIIVINNLTSAGIKQSVDYFADRLRDAQMVFIPGGFSGGDEPDGSGKFITAFFRNAAVKDGVTELLEKRDGLMCGICNGFQALIKLGLVPYGKIIDTDENCPTLTFNTIARHQSKIVRTRIASNKSPFLSLMNVGDIVNVPISHGEGRFYASEELILKLAENGQIATQYVDLDGNATSDVQFNPNNSMYAIEGITSPDGRVFGKMGHSERVGEGLYKNVEGNYDIRMFEAAVKYFK